MEHEEERQVVCEEQCIHAHDKTKIGKPATEILVPP